MNLRLSKILQAEGLTKISSRVYISPRVEELTPDMEKAIRAAEKIWPRGLRLDRPLRGTSGGLVPANSIVLSVYMEGHASDQEFINLMVSTQVVFHDNGRVSVILRTPDQFNLEDDVEKVLFKGRSFGPAAAKALLKAEAAFKYWETRID